MNQSQLKPAGSFAQQYGVKMIAYGPPGSGKTPLVNTAPRPVLLICEPGMLSMRGSTVPTWDGFTSARIDEFMAWVFQSKEAANFDTLAIDSISQMAEIRLREELARNKDGRKAYGEMSRWVYAHLSGLYYLQNKHTYLISKEGTHDEGGVVLKRAYFPGQELNIQIPHLYDLVSRIAKVAIAGMPGLQLAIQSNANYLGHARDRSGRLNEYEPPNLSQLFAKAMS